MYQRTSSFRDCQLGLVTLHGGLSCGFSITWKSWERSGNALIWKSEVCKDLKNSKLEGGFVASELEQCSDAGWVGTVCYIWVHFIDIDKYFVSIWNRYSTFIYKMTPVLYSVQEVEISKNHGQTRKQCTWHSWCVIKGLSNLPFSWFLKSHFLQWAKIRV